MKDHPIILGIDDATFNLKSGNTDTYLIGVICQGTRMVKVQKQRIKIDGDNSTEKIIKLVKENEDFVQYILTHTITFGGFNIMDLKQVNTQTQKPIVAVTEREVDMEAVKFALKKKYPESYSQKVEKITNAGKLYQMKIKTSGGYSPIYYHKTGISIKKAEILLRKSSMDSKLPEPIRMAHLIGRIFKPKE